MQAKQVKNTVPTVLLIERLGWKDYYDCYSASFRSDRHIPLEQVVIAFFLSMPNPVRWMLHFREKIARRLGLKTANGSIAVQKEIEQFSGSIGGKVALMEVWDRNDVEILTGQRDKHLDFALSFVLHRIDHEYELQLITSVKINNNLGKLHFLFVRPVHKMIMPFIVRNMAKHLSKNS